MQLTIQQLQCIAAMRCDIYDIVEKNKLKPSKLDGAARLLMEVFIEKAHCLPPNTIMNTTDLKKYIKERSWDK